MSQGEMHLTDPRLPADFAIRVLERVDVVVAHRRRVRNVVAGGASIGAVAVAMVLGTGLFSGSPTSAPRREPVYVASVPDFEIPRARPAGQTDALSYLLPDAAPLSRFAVEYSDATDSAASDEDVLGDEED